MELLYTLCVGIPLCFFCMVMGVFACCTIIGIPLGLTLFAIGNKALTWQK